VGVIPGPAELYIVRVFNDSGDVNQGQGLVYGSTVILAFTQCEGRLAALQVGSCFQNKHRWAQSCANSQHHAADAATKSGVAARLLAS
jgi:hypothetical protein